MFTRDHPVTGFTHLGDVIERPRWLQRWEKTRHGSLHWLIEGLGEFIGVYFYVYCGVGATAAFNIGNLAKEAGIGSLFTVGFGYAIGIVLAISIGGPASGAHFNPCVTIAQCVWRGFPVKKAPVYIFFQILGAYFACFLVYGQYRTTLQQLEEGLIAAGQYDAVQFTTNGVAGIFALYVSPTANMRDTFMNEFFVDFLLGLVIWGALDPTNYFVPPTASPWVIGFTYAAVIWGYAPAGLAANSARDLGGRFMAMTVWGKAASGGTYAAIAALTNIPAMLLATLVYELILTDSSRVLPRAQQEFLNGHKAHLDHLVMVPEENQVPKSTEYESDEKTDIKGIQHV
ncbi:aquaporin-like protein [Ramaria rubella]|nr:aquaporin-like protein [Ramaria rubella]